MSRGVIGFLQVAFKWKPPREVFNNWETDPKDKPVKEIQLVRMEACHATGFLGAGLVRQIEPPIQVFKNPFKETIEEMNKPKVEKAGRYHGCFFLILVL